MRKYKRMDQVKDILRVYSKHQSIKATARLLSISKNTVRTYIRIAEADGRDLPKLINLKDSEFLSLFYPSADDTESARKKIFDASVQYWTKELRKTGVTKHLLWEEYRIEHPEGYGYSQFCELFRRRVGHKHLTLHIEHKPGEKLQVDFAGKKMSWIDRHSGEVHSCEVLVGVMPYSQHTFAIALPSQSTLDFIDGLNAALLFFGKLPPLILSDNLKAYVIRADRYEPQFNELTAQLAAHYGIDLQATRPAKPKDKASVENMVSTVYTRIYAPLRNEIFHSLEELNAAILRQLNKHNEVPYQKKEGCRQDIFNTHEAPLMRALPSEIFEVKKNTRAKAQRNYHVFLGEDKNYYSVPFRYVGRETRIIYTSKTVEIYVENQRIATHKRLTDSRTYRYQTRESHMPKSHQEWKKSEGYDAEYFLGQGRKIGPAAHWTIAQVLSSGSHQSQKYKSCQGILQLGKNYGTHRLELACERCKKVGKVNYTMLKRILEHKLDTLENQNKTDFVPPVHDNIRGAQAYQ